jgi:hypothetical protein
VNAATEAVYVIRCLKVTYLHNEWPCITSGHLYYQFYYFYIAQYLSPRKRMETSSIESRIILAIRASVPRIRIRILSVNSTDRIQYP